MENKKIPYLCGGTLFFLLVQAKKPRAKAREREKGVKDGLKDPAMMDGLLRAITGNSGYTYADSLKKNTSQFRECRIDGSVYIPFNDPATASAYDYEVKNSYVTVLSRMSRFSEEFVNPAKASWLIRVLLDVIDQDAGIGDETHFYIQSDGTFISKTDVLFEMHFELQPFLVGIIHYILMNRSDNISGQDTLEDWGTKASERSERKLKKDFSLGKSRTATIDWYTSSEPAGSLETAESEDEPSEDKEYIDAEVVDGESSGAADNQKKQEGQSVTIIQQQTNVMQFGEKSVSLVNNGTINIDL